MAKAGSIVRASERLHLAPQTTSGQIGVLEETLGVALFPRLGRRLELTEAGRLATLSYADEVSRSEMSWEKHRVAVQKPAPFSFVWVSTMPFPSLSLIGC